MSDASPLAAPRRAPHGEASARTLEQASGQPGARSARGSRPFRPWRHLVAVALLAALHLLLLHLMAEEQTVAKLFAAGALDLGSLLVVKLSDLGVRNEDGLKHTSLRKPREEVMFKMP